MFKIESKKIKWASINVFKKMWPMQRDIFGEKKICKDEVNIPTEQVVECFWTSVPLIVILKCLFFLFLVNPTSLNRWRKSSWRFAANRISNDLHVYMNDWKGIHFFKNKITTYLYCFRHGFNFCKLYKLPINSCYF